MPRKDARAVLKEEEVLAPVQDQPYIVISTDSHIGPPPEALREYCDPNMLADFDEFIEQVGTGEQGQTLFVARDSETNDRWRDFAEDPAVNDPHQRLRNMDEDGMAAESIFHGLGPYPGKRSFLPFHVNAVTGQGRLISSTGVGAAGGQATAMWDREHEKAGRHIFNRWLADFCSVDNQRLIGIAELPYWDPEACAREVEWAAEAGFRGVNLAAPRPGMPTYDNPVWEPFFAAVDAADLSLNCHSGLGIFDFFDSGVATSLLYQAQNQILGRLPLSQLIFGGVFRRHPSLRVAFNEQRGYWIRQALQELDAIYMNPWSRAYQQEFPELPSFYWQQNCFLGGSFLAHFELVDRHEIGVETITWGRDFPHMEGTWPYTEAALRAAFYDMPEEETRTVLGDSGIRLYNLDRTRFAEIAARIGPRPSRISQPLETVPEGSENSFSFRDRPDAVGGPRFGAF
jgi:predicted TIM-barrel fold metal-dependent hydrolase